ncbi:DUF4129 domain-containing protein [Mycolicibacterium litorale]|uniref:Protein-glutamine gamma-glutamyltransferase-like C-terminal domain-containing protein n=1 Tax=Mycolicibacterium litorale TaxID=758802 RepID=A0AAD1IN64_9MYCO|nr:DUF4129 domain-containing protein [Mycolicibacterium litorale]MCV7417207.1 DUF4129 domain-containing protein [Mycolicibacterium litorale]TDY04995.1 uncharacterized protein DUF4129 [Mycolicibacterium litorale]BBY18425.1 hypothetical protein MLIT_40170 [Mycolicibacterium litorale]
MPGADKATARTVAVIVLILLAGVALRGHLPGAEPPPEEPAEPGAGPLVAVVVMLALSMAVIAISVISQSRSRVVRPDTVGDLPRDRAGGRTRWTWRMVLLVAVALVLWLLVVLALMRVSGWLDGAVDQPEAPEPSPGPTAPTDDPLPPPAEAEPPSSGAALTYLGWAAAVFVVLSVAGAMVGRSQRRRPVAAAAVVADSGAAPVSRTQTLARAAERGLVAIGDLSREPREAIIACYAAMERELGRSPGAMPLDSDTPTEVLARAVDRKLLRGDNATELVDLFEEARFSSHVMGEEHREAAVRVLQLVLRELQDAA